MDYQELAVRLVLLAMKHRDVKEYTEANLDYDAQRAGNAMVAAALEFLGKHKMVTDVQPVFSSNGAAFAYKLSSARDDDALIDWVCDRYEEAWKESLLDDDMREASPELCDSDRSQPAIENYLGEIPEPGRSKLLHGLLSSELELRAEHGDAPSQKEYLDRFSGDQSTVVSAWQILNPTPSELPDAGPHPRQLFPLSPQQLAEKLPHLEMLDDEIRQGGMGAVYKARDSAGRLVGVKVLPPECSDDADFVGRFDEEAKVLASLNHPNIVRIHHYEKRERLYYFTMEYAESGSLRDKIDKKKYVGLPYSEAIDFTLQVCEGLRFAHDQGVVHRDIKPENILLDRNGRVKIADFGLAKLIDPKRPSALLTKTNEAMGTPDYMAPEQKRAARDIDHRADIYSLGVVLYELLTGERPMGAFDPPSEKNRNSPEWLDEIVRCCLRDRRDDRFNNVGEIIDSIGQRRLERVRGHVRTASGRFPDEYFEILREGPPPEKLSTFLKGYPNVLGTALDGYFIPPLLVDPEHPFWFRSGNLGSFRPHLSVGVMAGTTPNYEWRHLLFCPAQGRLFDNGTPIDELAHAIVNLGELDAWYEAVVRQGKPFAAEDAGGSVRRGFLQPRPIESQPTLFEGAARDVPEEFLQTRPYERQGSLFDDASRVHQEPLQQSRSRKSQGDPDPLVHRAHHEGIILAGRRDQLPAEDRECIERLRSQGILIRSYDWLFDAWAKIRP